jgi:hypothetical protein
MRRLDRIRVLCLAAGLCLLTPGSYAQQSTLRLDSERHWYSGFTHAYTSPVFPAVSLANSTRLDSLLHAGKLYLALSDAIALGIENNLDVEIERYVFPLANADLLRAQSGAATLGIPTTVHRAIDPGQQQRWPPFPGR